MKRGGPRGLRPDEQQLWDKIRQNATPLHTQKRQAMEAAVEKINALSKHSRLPQFRVGVNSRMQPPQLTYSRGLSEHLASAPVQMDHKRFGRMKKGKLKPEARIDLHGMTIAQAHPALAEFVLRAHADSMRLVLVITGKGKAGADDGLIPDRKGALKRQVPQWLHAAPLKTVVLQVSEAHIKHGGTGAYYVYLRRHR